VANSRREKELARQRAERQAARRAAAAARRKQRNAVIASVLAVCLVAGAGVALAVATRSGDGDAVATPSGEPAAEPDAEVSPDAETPPSAPPAPGTCAYTPAADASRPAPLPPTEDVEDELIYTATVTTSQGPIVLDLDSAAAPCTVNSFRSLAQASFFADTPCHRLTASESLKVLQCGDPTGTGTGGPGYAFAEENLDSFGGESPEAVTYVRGTVAMANAGPGTNGSQFFLVYADSKLPPAYTPFGTITAGLDILDRVAAGGVDPAADPAPVIPVQVQSVTVVPKA